MIDFHATICKYIKCYTGSWLTLIILGLITEKQMMRALNSRAQVQCTSRRPWGQLLDCMPPARF